MKETILLVDDEQGIRTVMGLSLRDAGYNVITVASGEEALQLFAERPIPIVITDIRMPGMNGLDLLKHIKILAPETEVILISGHADLEMAIQGLKLEASDFITKPIDDDLLHISLKRALERIAMRNKLKEYTSNLEKMINEKSAQLVEAERQLAARQVVDGFAFGLHTLGSSMSGEQQAFNELPCFIAMHDRFMEVLAVNDLYRERLGAPELGALCPAQQRGHVPRGAGHCGGPRRAQRADPARQERQGNPRTGAYGTDPQ